MTTTLIKQFEYNPQRIMSAVEDELGRRTEYDIDGLGRRIGERIYDSNGSDKQLVQHSTFDYEEPRFPGFMTKKTVLRIDAIETQSWVVDLVVEYAADDSGRIATETVDPDGLALQTSYTYDKNGNKLTVTDPLGRVTQFSYDVRNRLIGVQYADESEKSYTYDARGNKLSETDENDHQTLFEYDTLNRVTKQTRVMGDSPGPDDLVTQFSYNKVNSKLTVTDPNGNITQYQYDGLQRLIRLTDALNNQTTYEYGVNSGGNTFDVSSFKPTKTTDPRGYVTQVTYDSLYRPTQKSVQYQLSPALYSITHAAFDYVGNQTSSTDPLGNETQTAYDTLNRVIQVTNPDTTTIVTSYSSTGLKYQVQDELGRQTNTEYDAAGRATKLIQPQVDDGSGTMANPVIQTQYDAVGNVTKTINPLNYEWNYSYDLRNRKIEEQQPEVVDASDGVNKHPTIQTEYDLVGNPVQLTDANGNVTSKEYDNNNRLIKVTQPLVYDAISQTDQYPITQTQYDKNGNITVVLDPRGYQTNNSYDALNRLTKTVDAASIEVDYTYDQVGNKLSVKDGKNQTTSFTYDGLNRNLTVTDPASNTTTLGYDALNKIQRSDAIGQITTYSYDSRNRLTNINYQGRSQDNRVYSYDDVGNLTEVELPNRGDDIANVLYDYDALNRVTSESSNQQTHSYNYDLAGNRLKTIYGGTSRTITSTYDAINRLATMTESARTSTYGYDLNGNILKLSLPNNDLTSKVFDAINRTTLITTNTNGTTLLASYEQEYDLAGNVINITETNAASGLPNRTITNNYDSIYRLESEVIVSGTDTVSTTYSYDAANNRSQKVVVGGDSAGTTSYTYNNLNQLTQTTDPDGTTTYTYDQNGNRSSKSGVAPNYLTTESDDPITTETGDHLIVEEGALDEVCQYDYENRLIKLTQNGQNYLYGYDYRTRRVYRNEGNGDETISFSGGTSISEWGSAGSSPLVEYLRGSDYGGGVGGILYTYRNNVPSFTHYDSRGDVTIKTDQSGNRTYQAQYEAFGSRSKEQGSTLDRQKANTKDEDPTGLLNEGFRYRDLQTGTFITRDPAGFIDGPNLYTYVNQNPWSKFDPEGLNAWDVTKGYGVGFAKAVYSGTIGVVTSTGQQWGKILSGESHLSDIGGLKYLANQQVRSAIVDNIKSSIVQKVTGSDYDRGELAGNIVGSVATIFAVTKAASTLQQLSKIENVVSDAQKGGMLFRGTTEGFSGGANTLKTGITPTTTSPAIASTFAAEAGTQGPNPIVLGIQAGRVPITGGNVLGAMEREIGVQLRPLELSSKASFMITSDQSRSILSGMGIGVPRQISKSWLNEALSNLPTMEGGQVAAYTRQAMQLGGAPVSATGGIVSGAVSGATAMVSKLPEKKTENGGN